MSYRIESKYGVLIGFNTPAAKTDADHLKTNIAMWGTLDDEYLVFPSLKSAKNTAAGIDYETQIVED